MTARSADEESSDAAIRAFVAVALDAVAREGVARVIAALRQGAGGGAVRWVPPENLHVTLCFLGDTSMAKLGLLVAELRPAAAALQPFSMLLGGVAVFPSPRRPRVLSCEAGPAPALGQLAEAVVEAASRIGFPRETRPFRPHLTLGRFRERERSPVTVSVTGVNHAVAVDEIVLYRSELRSSGAVHTPLERIALGGTDHPRTRSFEIN